MCMFHSAFFCVSLPIFPPASFTTFLSRLVYSSGRCEPFLVYLIRIAFVISRSHLLILIGWYQLPFTTQRAQRLR